jgi:hypothetical protein
MMMGLSVVVLGQYGEIVRGLLVRNYELCLLQEHVRKSAEIGSGMTDKNASRHLAYSPEIIVNF